MNDGMIGQLTGVRVIESRNLTETAIYYSPRGKVIICGRLSALHYQMTKAQVRIDIRADLERQLDAFAKRVGVDRSTLSE